MTKTAVVVASPDTVPGYGEFEIDIEKVIKADLPARFKKVESAALTIENIEKLPRLAKGAYMLILDGAPVYAGKTDTRHGFQSRLARHFNTVQHRRGLDPAKISFKAVRIMVFSNFDAEAILIAEQRRLDKAALAWNDTGFGSNDPGHRREGQRPAKFDLKYPVDIDVVLPPDFLSAGAMNLRDALVATKERLPYVLRYETDLDAGGESVAWKVGHVEQRAATIVVPPPPLTVRLLVQLALGALPDEWVATVMADRVILYKGDTVWHYGQERLTK